MAAREAAARFRGEDVGVHLTINAEWDLYRWGPITQSPSLLDGDDYWTSPDKLRIQADFLDVEALSRQPLPGKAS